MNITTVQYIIIAGINKTQQINIKRDTILLTAAELQRAGVCVHGEILQLHGAFC